MGLNMLKQYPRIFSEMIHLPEKCDHFWDSYTRHPGPSDVIPGEVGESPVADAGCYLWYYIFPPTLPHP